MGWIEPVSTAVTAASLAKDAVTSSTKIKTYSSRLRYWLINGSAKIPIFGAGGAGKSTAGKLLTGTDPLELNAPYAESWDLETLNLKGAVPGSIIVAPGQKPRVDRHWPELMKNIVGGKSFGLINVVANGLHSLELTSITEHSLFQNGQSVTVFMDVYTRERRKIELDLLKKLLGGLAGTDSRIWMVTLVNKQDLWWDARDAVKREYESGEYGKTIESFAEEHGRKNFQHEFLPVSLVLGNLNTTNGECLAKTTAGYDMPLHLRYLRSMYERIHSFISKGIPK